MARPSGESAARRRRRDRRPGGPSAPRRRRTARPPARRGLVGLRPGRRVVGVCGQRRGDGDGLDHRQRAAAAVERVRAGVGVADGVEAEDQRGAVVVDEAPESVEEAAHRTDPAEGLQRTRLGRTGRGRAAADRPRSKPSGSLSAVRRSRSSGSMARVIDSVSPSPGTPMNFTKRRSPPSLGSRTRVAPGGEPVPARQVHEPAGADLLGDLDAVLGQPLRHRAAAAHGRQDHVGLDLRRRRRGSPR